MACGLYSRSMVVTLGFTLLLAALGCPGGRSEPPEAAAAATIDPRTPVVLPAADQQAVLREMRQMLGAVAGVLAAAATGDTGALVAAVAPVGSAASVDPALDSVLPATWKELAQRTHHGFDSLAATVRRTHEKRALQDTVLVRVAQLIGSCTSCHETYRVTLSGE